MIKNNKNLISQQRSIGSTPNTTSTTRDPRQMIQTSEEQRLQIIYSEKNQVDRWRCKLLDDKEAIQTEDAEETAVQGPTQPTKIKRIISFSDSPTINHSGHRDWSRHVMGVQQHMIKGCWVIKFEWRCMIMTKGTDRFTELLSLQNSDCIVLTEEFTMINPLHSNNDLSY
jgi:hypothetical protein